MPTNKILLRARLVFLILVVLFFISSGSALYAGWTSGEISERIVQPIKNKFSQIAHELAKETEKKPETVAVASPSGDLFVEFEKEPPKTTPKTTKPKSTLYPPSTNTQTDIFSNYEESRRQQEAWWQQVQQDQQNFAQEAQRHQQEFAQQAQQDMEKFKAESESKVQEFRNSQPQLVCTTTDQGKICKLE